jgi:hypothetical protein
LRKCEDFFSRHPLSTGTFLGWLWIWDAQRVVPEIFNKQGNHTTRQNYFDLKKNWSLVVVMTAVETWKRFCGLCLCAEMMRRVQVANCGNRGKPGADDVSSHVRPEFTHSLPQKFRTLRKCCPHGPWSVIRELEMRLRNPIA